MKSVKKMIKFYITNSWFWFFTFVALFNVLILYPGVTINYVDYGGGTYLYVSRALTQGKLFYRDIFAVQPPLLYLYGSVIWYFFHSVIAIRFVNLVLLNISALIFFISLKKIFKNDWIALFTTTLGFVETGSVMIWWSTFTGENLQRFLIALILWVLSFKKNDDNKTLSIIVLLSILLLFVKYTSIFLILGVFIYLFILNKKKGIVFSIAFTLLTILILVILQVITNGRYLEYTIFIRNNLRFGITGIKRFIFLSVITYRSYFIFLALAFIIYFLKIKSYLKTLPFILQVFYYINILSLLSDGTFAYVLSPVNFLYPLPFVYGIYILILKKKTKMRAFLKTLLIIVLFLSSVSILFTFQTIKSDVLYTSNPYDVKNTQKIKSFLESRPGKDILSSGYFAVISGKNIIKDYYDPFMFIRVLKGKKNDYDWINAKTKTVSNMIKKGKINTLVFDWRLMDIFQDVIEHNSHYKLSYNIKYKNNPYEVIYVYTLKK